LPSIATIDQLLVLLESATAGLWMWQIPDNQVYWSPGMHETLGISPSLSSLQYTDIRGYLHPEDLQRFDAAVEASMRSLEPFAVECRLRRADGSYLPVESRGHIFSADGRPGTMMGFILDRTDQKRSEAALVRSERRFREVLDRAPMGVMLKDAHGRHLYANRAASQILGIDPTDLVGKTTWELLPREQAEALVEVDRRVLNGGSVENWEGTVKSLGGQERWVADLKFPIDGPDGDPLVAGFAIDLTERRRMEKERAQLEEKLHRMHKLESLGLLAGGVAHDFNNILVGILGEIELAQDELEPHHPALRSLQAATQSSRRAADLCAQLLSYAGGEPLHLDPVEPNDIVRQELLSVPGSSLSLTYDLEESLPSVRVDAMQMRQVFFNLVMNAREALGAKAGAVRFRTRSAQRIDPEHDLVHDWLPPEAHHAVRFDVIDDGPGIEASLIGQVCDPFFTTKREGHGLGLAAALGIIRRHRGALGISSQPGRGTCISIYLAASSASASRHRSSSPAPPPVSVPGSRSALVVDDESAVRAVMARMLERSGLAVRTASNGAEALDIVRGDAKLDVIFLDLTMPGLSGVDTLNAIRELNTDVPVVISSGYSRRLEEENGALPGVTTWLKKPFGIGEVRACLREVFPSQA
jgi:PAS domain S-box-containing protein